MAKEIAYQWAKNELLTSKKLLLLVFLRECYQMQLKSVENLVQYVFKNSKMVSCLTNHLLQTEGSNTVIIFDGFDELSEEIKKESIIIEIINRRILTKCCLVVTSRPTASSCLHVSVDRRIEIVGFTEEDRLDYIQSAFKNCDDQVKALQQYLKSNPTINALCYIPLNMTILLCLAEDGIDALPNTQTELYKNFTQMAIIRFIKRYEILNTIISIANLPDPYNTVFIELAKLAFEALKTDKIVFTLSEIEQGCPNLTMNPSNWNGLGLLKAVRYFSPQMGNDQVTFHFLHFSVQEYMAAQFIATLSDNKQIKLLKKTFWKHRYYNTWIMYVGITSGSSFALRHFLSGNQLQFYSKLFKPSKVSNKYLRHKMKRLHLFQCLVEADKEDDIKSVKQLFQSNQIDLSNQTLLPRDLNILGFFLIRSINKEWRELDLSYCNIGLNGSKILCDRLLDKDVRSIVIIKRVNFSHNQLNCDSVIRLFGLFKSWHTSEIIITDDAILDSITDIKKIEDIVLQSSTLTLVFIGCYLFSKSLQLNKILANTTNIKSLYLLNCNWKSDHSEILKLPQNQKLEKVRIIGPSVDTTMIKTIACMLVHKNNFVNMLVYDPTMSDENGDFISSLIFNQNKDKLGLVLIVTHSKIQGFINTCVFNNELSALELYNLNEYLKTKMHLWRQDIDYSSENITCNAFIKTLSNNNDWFLQVLLLEGDTVVAYKTDFFKPMNAVISMNLQNIVKLDIFRSNITDQAADDIASLISYNIHLQEFNLSANMVQALGMLKISRSLLNILSLTKLYINHNNITYEATDNIAAVISHNKNLQEFDISGNNLQTAGVIKIMKALKGLNTLRKLYISNNSITDKVTDNIAAVISHNKNLQEFDISGNNLQTAGVIKIMKALKGLNTLRKLYISNNSITDEVADYITAVLSCNTGIEVLDISGNNLQANGAIKIGNFLQNIYTPKTLFITNTDNPADVDISAVISDNASLQEIYIYNNNLQTTEVEIFTKPLQAICTLSKLHIGYNNITKEAAKVIATVVSINADLQELNLGCNDLQKLGAIKIAKGLQKISSLTKLYIDHNNITDAAAHDVAAAISCNIHLQELNLGGNDLQTSGIIVIARSLQKISSLKVLHINDNYITYEAADDIATAISCNVHLRDLNIGGNDLRTSGIIVIARSLQKISSLKVLHINDNYITYEAADDIATAISCNVHLRDLNIGGNDLQASGIIVIARSLQKISSLRKLYINHSNITNKAADNIGAAISCNANLQELDLGGNNFLAFGIISILKGLQKISSLTKLYIELNSIGDKAADDIAAVISCNINLQELNLGGNYFQTSGIIVIARSLQKISSLKVLHINDNYITYEAADDIATAISCNVHLRDLNIGGNDLQASGIIVIARSLQKISSLRKLYINQSNITNNAADNIRAAISCNANLQELNLGSNNLQASGIIEISKCLQKISSLTKLCIELNSIDYESADDIAAVISCNINLQELNLGGNDFQTSGIIVIARSLQKISSLKMLHINDNNITYEAADDIATAISCNVQLQDLNIGGNDLRTSGIIVIARSLQKNSSLRKLYINYSNITDEAAGSIRAAISCNTNLQELDLGYNNLQAFGIVSILKGLQKISSLTKLYINHNNITDEAADDIVAAILSNQKLQEFDISGNILQLADRLEIAMASKDIATLRKLSFSNSIITDYSSSA